MVSYFDRGKLLRYCGAGELCLVRNGFTFPSDTITVEFDARLADTPTPEFRPAETACLQYPPVAPPARLCEEKMRFSQNTLAICKPSFSVVRLGGIFAEYRKQKWNQIQPLHCGVLDVDVKNNRGPHGLQYMRSEGYERPPARTQTP